MAQEIYLNFDFKLPKVRQVNGLGKSSPRYFTRTSAGLFLEGSNKKSLPLNEGILKR